MKKRKCQRGGGERKITENSVSSAERIFFPQSHWWNLKTRKVFTCTMENGKWKEELSVSLLLVGRPSQYTEGRERESPKYDVSASLSAVVLGCYSEFQFNFQMSDHRFSDKFGEKATWGSVLGTVLT